VPLNKEFLYILIERCVSQFSNAGEFPPSAAEVGSYIYRSAIFRVFNEFLWCLPVVLLSELA
jgi:hypothetical protein